MSTIPFELPLRSSEAAALADLVFQQVEGKEVTDDQRARLSSRCAAIELTTIRPFWGSLVRDPVHSGTYYLAVDARAVSTGVVTPLLLRLALATAPSSGLFPGAMLIGRMRPGGGREVVVNAIEFSHESREAVRTYVDKMDRAFLPRPQGASPAITVGVSNVALSLPPVLDAFRRVLRVTGVNYASILLPAGSAPDRFAAAAWGAIRAGWRDGYTIEGDPIVIRGGDAAEVERSIEEARSTIAGAAGFTKFAVDTSALVEVAADVRSPGALNDADVAARFEQSFDEEDRGWALSEFRREFEIGPRMHVFTDAVIRRLCVKFGRALQVNEKLFDVMRQTRVGSGLGRTFDFAALFDAEGTLTTPEELLFYLHWMKSRGRPTQIVAPCLGFREALPYPEMPADLAAYSEGRPWGEIAARVAEAGGSPLAELGARVRELAAVARHFNATLSFQGGSGKQAAVLHTVGQATAGRWNYRVISMLDQQLAGIGDVASLSSEQVGQVRKRNGDAVVAVAEALRG